jgi:hypothetical protein
MTVAAAGPEDGQLMRVTDEHEGSGEGLDVCLKTVSGHINPDLTVGADVTTAQALRANEGISCPGVKLHGAGFIVAPDRACELGLGRIQGLEKHIRLYRNGRDLTSRPRQIMVIDLFGLGCEEVRARFPEVYQHVVEHVKPERGAKSQGGTKDSQEYAKKWWLFGKPRSELRLSLKGLPRYIATVETSKHRFFVFLDATILPDNMLVNIALDDAFFLGVLSSRIHVFWALATGGRLGVGNDPRYNKTRCFEPFPFPICNEALKARIRGLGERLDAHRKNQQAAHASLTMTDMYNVLAKLRAGEALSAKDKIIHEQGLVAILRELHDELDLAVAEAYGWPHDLAEEEILQRLIALNHERIAAESRGQISWLRPEFQTGKTNQASAHAESEERPEPATDAKEAESDDATSLEKRPGLPGKKRPTLSRRTTAVDMPPGPKNQPGLPLWPKALIDQVRAVAALLSSTKGTLLVEEVARAFKGARLDRVSEILETLVSLGRARRAQGRPSLEAGSRYRSA